jgi:hypothetical protein
MTDSDILLEKDRVSVVGGDGSEEVDGRERGDLEVSVGRDASPSVRLNADRANLTLGGGDGNAPEGDVKLLDRGGTTRVQITAERGNQPPGDDRVWINGGRGEIELGVDRGVRISGEGGEFIDAEINVGGPVTGDDAIQVVKGAANVTALTDDDGDAAGAASFSDHGRTETAVSIRGDQAALGLGYSVVERTVDTGAEGPYGIGGSVSTEYEVVASESGKIYFDDGSGKSIRIIAEDGTLKIGGDSDGDGTYDEEYLVIDTDNREIRTPWTFVEN